MKTGEYRYAYLPFTLGWQAVITLIQTHQKGARPMALFRLLALSAFALVISGCAAPGLPFKQIAIAHPEKHALVYVYRPASFVNAAGYPYVYVSGHDRVPLKNGGYVPFLVPSGETEVLVKGEFLTWGLPEQKAKITVEAGGEYFLRFSSSTAGLVTPTIVGKSLNLGLVNKEIGLIEISETKESR